MDDPERARADELARRAVAWAGVAVASLVLFEVGRLAALRSLGLSPIAYAIGGVALVAVGCVGALGNARRARTAGAPLTWHIVVARVVGWMLLAGSFVLTAIYVFLLLAFRNWQF